MNDLGVSWKRLLLDNLLFELSSPVRNQVLIALSAFVFVFLLLFQPFNLASATPGELLLTALGSATALYLIGWWLNSLRAAGKWPAQESPLLAELIYVVIYVGTVGFAVYLFRLRSDYVDFSLSSALQFQLFAFSSAVVVLFVSRLLTAVIRLNGASQALAELQDSVADASTGKTVSLSLTSGEKDFKFPLSRWIAAKAAGNYLELYFSTNGGKPVVLVRSTLKLLVQAMDGTPEFYQCHRSFAINLAFVDRLRGRSQAYKLQMNGMNETVPVSRSLEKDLLGRLPEGSH